MMFLPYIFRAIRLRQIFSMADIEKKPFDLDPFRRLVDPNQSVDLDSY